MGVTAQQLFPSKEDVRHMAETALSVPVEKMERFNTGNHHFVYDVHLSDGRNIVVRAAYLKEKKALEGALYWSELLKPRGVPLPEILYADLSCTKSPFPFMILARLPGTDLRYVYKTMLPSECRTLVAELVRIQNSVTSLPQAKGFGYAEHMDGPFEHQSWKSILAADILKTRTRMTESGYFSLRYIDALEKEFENFSGYFEDVRPTPFLHDMTTKNVMVHEGKLTGIVDVDSLCFGDPLHLPGLIQAAFMGDDLDTHYIGYWKEALHLDDRQKKIVDFYSAQSLAYIMGEVGLQQNKEQPQAPDPADMDKLSALLSSLLEKF